MAKMPTTLGLPDPATVKGASPELIAYLTRLVRALTNAFDMIFTDVHHKEMVYFDVDQKRWRMGPWPPRTTAFPNGNFAADPSDWNFEIQYFTGTDYGQQWRDNTYWEMQWLGYGGDD
ncbi:MAG: hypothetical protein ACYS8Z_20645 [Planctomycetota bacterium]|jgi:hypothetical protein